MRNGSDVTFSSLNTLSIDFRGRDTAKRRNRASGELNYRVHIPRLSSRLSAAAVRPEYSTSAYVRSGSDIS